MDAEEAEAGPSQPPPESEQPATVTSDSPGRLLIFDTLVDKFLKCLVEAGSYERFAHCYKKFYKLQPEFTRAIYNQFLEQLHASIQAEIQDMKEEGNLKSLLDSLDKMEKEAAKQTESQWRPTGVPEEDLRDHLVPFLLQQRDYLHKLVKEQDQENARLEQAVMAGRRRIQEMQQEIQRRQQAWQKLSQSQKELILSIQSGERL
ncbi:polyamine-modulated factor 1-like [Gastrophryne carolinensis]